jgi:hypothetical protein
MSDIQVRDLTDRIAVEQETHGYVSLDRGEVIRAIRTALKRRSGKTWSVTGGRGTAWGWLRIDAPKARRTGKFVKVGTDDFGNDTFALIDTGEAREFGYMTPDDQRELTELLGLGQLVHHQGHQVASSNGHWIEAIARAEGRNPSTYGVQYWD